MDLQLYFPSFYGDIDGDFGHAIYVIKGGKARVTGSRPIDGQAYLTCKGVDNLDQPWFDILKLLAAQPALQALYGDQKLVIYGKGEMSGWQIMPPEW